MSWHHYLTRISDGLIGAEIQIPSFSWDMKISDSSMSPKSMKSKGVGEGGADSITIPWTAIPGRDSKQRDVAIREGKVAVTTFWKSPKANAQELGTPIFWGVISDRTDTWLDVSFSLDGIMTVLGRQYVMAEGVYANKADTITLTGTAQDLCKQIIKIVNTKPGGGWPIDFDTDSAVGTDPVLTLKLNNWDTSNITAAGLLTKLANVDNGPDIQFRPYLADSSHVRLLMMRGHPFLDQQIEHNFNTYVNGGSVQEFKIVRSASRVASRVYGVGAGTGAGTLRAFAEDVSLVGATDSWPMYETAVANTSAETSSVLQSATSGRLATVKHPLMQFSGVIRADGPVQVGQLFPGEMTNLTVQGHPSLPDGIYRVRMMELSGDETPSINVKWDVLESSF